MLFGQAASTKAEDFALIGFENFELQTFERDFFSCSGNMAGNMVEQAGKRRGARFGADLVGARHVELSRPVGGR